MRIWFDTEFIDDGRTIDLISIGMVREDGAELYLQNADCDLTRACPWVEANVLTRLNDVWTPRHEIASRVVGFAGTAPEFWAYFAAYDWVALCQLYGRLVDLPPHWPQFCNDLRQIMPSNRGIPSSRGEHHALADARAVRNAWLGLHIKEAA